DLDIAITGQNNDIKIFKNNSAGSFTYSSTAAGLGAGLFKQGDFDSDGDIDFVSYRDDGTIGVGLLKISINDGNGNFIPGFQGYSGCGCPIEGDHISSFLTVNDFDNDGDLDVLYEGKQTAGITPTNCECGYLFLIENNGSGNFPFGRYLTLYNYFDNAVSDDINNDGFVDLITSSTDIYNNNYPDFTQSSFPGSGGTLAAADFDGDGDLDLAENNQTMNLFKFYKNNSLGSFSNLSSNSVNPWNKFISPGDFDNDGDIDLIFIHNGGNVSALLNDYNCSDPAVILSGNLAIPVNSTNNIFVSSTDNGFWDISNYDSCQASISSGQGNDTIIINAGGVLGHFVLYFNAYTCSGSTVIFEKHAYVENPSSLLHCSMAVIPEGFLDLSTNRLRMRDTLSVYLRKREAPYEIADSVKTVLDSVSMIAQFDFTNAPTGNYFLVVKHRNSVETWSKAEGIFFIKGTTAYYNFTNSADKAYGNNLTLKGSVYCIYSGDVLNNGSVNLDDILKVYNNSLNFATGYKLSDVTGDNTTDLSDLVVTFNNVVKFAHLIRP
ncbi:MAG: VCBS repeat-containing protein, partial [Ignavibacteria bacterium]